MRDGIRTIQEGQCIRFAKTWSPINSFTNGGGVGVSSYFGEMTWKALTYFTLQDKQFTSYKEMKIWMEDGVVPAATSPQGMAVCTPQQTALWQSGETRAVAGSRTLAYKAEVCFVACCSFWHVVASRASVNMWDFQEKDPLRGSLCREAFYFRTHKKGSLSSEVLILRLTLSIAFSWSRRIIIWIHFLHCFWQKELHVKTRGQSTSPSFLSMNQGSYSFEAV